MKQRRSYEKPSERKVREKAEAIRRARKLARKKAQREGLIDNGRKKKALVGSAQGQRRGCSLARRRHGFVRQREAQLIIEAERAIPGSLELR
jgi:hypothetical protein